MCLRALRIVSLLGLRTGSLFLLLLMHTSTLWASTLSVVSFACTYDTMVPSPTNCPTMLFSDVRSSAVGPVSAHLTGNAASGNVLSTDYVFQATANYGTLQAFTASSVAGTLTTLVSSIETRATMTDEITLTSDSATGSGLVRFGMHVSGSGTFSGTQGVAGSAQLWYRLGPLDAPFTFQNVSNISVDELLFSDDMPFTFGAPFSLRATLLARVDALCPPSLAGCTAWTASGTSDLSHTLQLISMLVMDSHGNPVPNVGVSADSGSSVYAAIQTTPIPEPSTLSLTFLGLAVGVLRVLRSGALLRQKRRPDQYGI